MKNAKQKRFLHDDVEKLNINLSFSHEFNHLKKIKFYTDEINFDSESRKVDYYFV